MVIITSLSFSATNRSSFFFFLSPKHNQCRLIFLFVYLTEKKKKVWVGLCTETWWIALIILWPLWTCLKPVLNYITKVNENHPRLCSLATCFSFFLGGGGVNSVQMCVWMPSGGQEWWECESSGFKEMDLIQNFKVSRATHPSAPQRDWQQETQFGQPISPR